MTAWLDPAALTAIAAAATIVLLPGLVTGLVLGLRGLVLLGAAPVVSIALVAASAVLAGEVGLAWGPLVPVAATVVTVLLTLVVRAVGARTRGDSPVGRGGAGLTGLAALLSSASAASLVSPARSDHLGDPHRTDRTDRTDRRDDGQRRGRLERRARHRAAPPRTGRWGWPMVGAAVGAGALVAQVLPAIATPTTISQAYDVVFHVNALAWIEASGDASSLHLRRVLGGDADGFYPAAWHGVASLVAALTGAGPVVATNALALVVAAGLWPLSVVLLADRVTGSPAHAATAGVLAGALPAAPVALLDWGVLYPVLLAMALVPAVLALLAALVAPRNTDRPPLGALVVLLGAGVIAVGLAHPSGAFTLAVLGAPLLLWAGASALRRAWARPSARRRAGTAVLAAALLTALALGAALTNPTLSAVAAYQWPISTTVPDAALAALVVAPPEGRAGNVPAALAVVVGAVAVHRLRARWSPAAPRSGPGAGWLVVAWAAAGSLYVVAQSTSSHPLTGPWYNDAYRLAPIVAVPALVLASHGIVTVVAVLAHLVGWRGVLAGDAAAATDAAAARPSTGRRAAPAPPRARAAGSAVAALLAGLLAVGVVVGPGSGRERTTAALEAAYRQGPGGDAPLLSADEEQLFALAATLVPPGTVIANDPFDGSGLSYALAGLDPLFRHMGSVWTPAGAVVKDDLARVGTDPAVCAAVREEDVGYLFALGHRYLDFVPRAAYFTQVQGAAEVGAFEEVARVGDARLLRLVRCGGEPVPPPG